eukprot:Gb_40837 [translate_table: standard]
MHGIFHTLTHNMVVGVSKGFERKLQLVGFGYYENLEGKYLVMNLGFSYPVSMAVPYGTKIIVEENTRITIVGSDKCAIGDFSTSIRKWCPLDL